MRPEDQKGVASGLMEGALRATGVGPEAGAAAEPLGPGQRWSVGRKREAVLRLLRGEPVEALSREIGVEIYRLEKWKERALGGIGTSLRERVR
jgi:transposase